MQAVEFEADIQNGMIPLPKELRLMQKGHLRVISLFPENSVDTHSEGIPKSRFEDVAGCLQYNGPAKTLEDMENAIKEGAVSRWK